MMIERYALVDGYSHQFYIFRSYPNWEHAKGTKVYLVQSTDPADVPLEELLGFYLGKCWKKIWLIKEY